MYNLAFSCEKYIHKGGYFIMKKDNVSFISPQRPPKKDNGLFKYVITQKGVYILLILCIIAAGVSSFIISQKKVRLTNSNSEDFELPPVEGMNLYNNNNKSQNGYVTSYSGSENYTDNNSLNIDRETLYSKGGYSTGEERVNAAADLSVPTPAPSPVPAPSAEPDDFDVGGHEFSVPALGQKIIDFYDKDLVYSRTFEDWRTHQGIDIAGSIGTQVMSIGRGTVKAIYFDDMYGNTVEIEHGGGVVSRYCNLQSGILVKENEKVERGTVIGGMNNTAPAEIADPPHLHFEILVDGVPDDPKKYFDI